MVERAGIDEVVTDSAWPDGLRHYLGDDLAVVPAESIEAALCEPRGELIYIHHLAYSNPHWDPLGLECLAGEPVVRVSVPQTARGRAIDVWILAAQRDRAAEDEGSNPATSSSEEP